MAGSNLFQLLYFSRAVGSVSESMVESILESSRANNSKAGITGILLFEEFHFMQVLEGTEAAVREIFGKIQQDERHTNIFTIYEREISERQFSGWAMAHHRLGESDEGLQRTFLEMVGGQRTADGSYPDQQAAIEYVRCFEAILVTR